MTTTSSRQEVLLKEYEVSQEAINSQNATAWQTGSIFVVGGMGVFAFVVQELVKSSFSPSLDTSILVSAVAALTWGMVYLWYRSYRRWGTFVEIAQRRMQEIERELGMWKNRDVDIVDTHIKKKEQPTDPKYTDQEETHVKLLKNWAIGLSRRGGLMATSVHVAVRGMVALLLFGWLAALVFTIPSSTLCFNRWHLSFGLIAIPALWFWYPQIRSLLFGKRKKTKEDAPSEAQNADGSGI